MNAAAPRLRLAGLSRAFGPIQAVDDFSFEVSAGEIHALCGHNGAGKSTVLNMLAGIITPDAGEIVIDGVASSFREPRSAQVAGIARVDQELSVIGELTVAENMSLVRRHGGLRSRRAATTRTRELLELVGLRDVEPTRRLAGLSLGQRQLVEIARALGRDARVLILDEPTATLNELEITHVFTAVRRVAERGCAVIFVSHRLGEVLALCDQVTVMRDGHRVHSGAAADLDAHALVKAMLGSLPETPTRRDVGVAPTERSRLRVEHLAVTGSVTSFSHEFELGRVYGLAGQVGSGASEVLRALAGLQPRFSGSAWLDDRRVPLGRPVSCARHGIAYASNDRRHEGLFLSQTLADNLTAGRLDTLHRALLRSGSGAVRDVAAPLADVAQLPRGRLGSTVAQLSGGNQQKVLVARALRLARIRALLIDEPTRGVDIGGRAAIHRLLRDAADAGLLVVFASTELEELAELADAVLTMRAGRLIGSYEGQMPKQQILDDLTHRELAA